MSDFGSLGLTFFDPANSVSVCLVFRICCPLSQFFWTFIDGVDFLFKFQIFKPWLTWSFVINLYSLFVQMSDFGSWVFLFAFLRVASTFGPNFGFLHLNLRFEPLSMVLGFLSKFRIFPSQVYFLNLLWILTNFGPNIRFLYLQLPFYISIDDVDFLFKCQI